MNKILLIYALIILNINTINSEEVNTQLQQQNTNNNVINNQQQVNNNPNELSVSKSNIDQNQTIQNNNQINTLGTSAPQQQVKNINVIDQQQQFSIIDSFIEQGDKHIRELFPENAYGMFNHPVDISKYNKDTLRVDFKLTKEICEAILKKDSKLIDIILNHDAKYVGAYKDILGKQINHMLEKFTSINDLKFIVDYLTITNGNPIYTPSSSMQNWLNSLECINEIQEVAIPFLEEIDNNKSSQSYELRISFYFRTNNNSEIVIPKAEQLSLLTQLKQIENNINGIINKQRDQLKNYQNEIIAINLNKEIQSLKQNENVIKLENINIDINKKNEEKNKITKEKEGEIKKIQGNNRYRNQKMNEIENKYRPKITALDNELKKLQDEKNKFGKEVEIITTQLQEKEEQYQQMKKSYDRTIGFVEVTIEQCNKLIIEQLNEAKKLFINNSTVVNGK